MNVAAVGLSDFFVFPLSASGAGLISTSAGVLFSSSCSLAAGVEEPAASFFFSPYSSFFSSRLSSQYELPAASFPVAARTSLVCNVGTLLTSSSTGLKGLLGDVDSVWVFSVEVVGVSSLIFSSDMVVMGLGADFGILNRGKKGKVSLYRDICESRGWFSVSSGRETDECNKNNCALCVLIISSTQL
jgi:hypothetical protein